MYRPFSLSVLIESGARCGLRTALDENLGSRVSHPIWGNFPCGLSESSMWSCGELSYASPDVVVGRHMPSTPVFGGFAGCRPIAATSRRRGRLVQEIENLRYELVVVLEDATVAGVGVDPKTRFGQPCGHVLGMFAGDHQVVVTVGDEDRDLDL